MKKLIFIMLLIPVLGLGQVMEPGAGGFDGYYEGDVDIVGNLSVDGHIFPTQSVNIFGYFTGLDYEFDNEEYWTHLTNTAMNLYTFPTADGFTVSNDSIKAQLAGKYELHLTVVLANGNNDVQGARLYNVTQGYEIPVPSYQTTDGRNNYTTLVIIGQADLIENDVIIPQLITDDEGHVDLRNSTISIKLIKFN